MSHELRTPLNSLLILSDQLSKNPDGNLTRKQPEFAKTIHSSGNDLLMLINDILDLSKIESGTVVVDASELRLDDLQGYVERTFRHVAESKNVDFQIRFDPRLPRSIFTDAKRLQQIIKNLLSNAFKFTHHGQVTLTVEPAAGGWSPDNEELNRAAEVLALRRVRHRHRHPGRQAADHLRGVPAGRRLAPAASTAAPAWAWRSAASCRGCWAARSGSSSIPGRGQHVPPVPARPPTRRRGWPARPPAGRGARRPSPAADRWRRPLPDRNGQSAPPARARGDRVDRPAGQRGRRRPRRHPARRPRAADRRERRRASPGSCSTRPARRGSRGWSRRSARPALALTREYKPDAITLDIHLPDIDGWRVLERLKNDPATRHIPVCVDLAPTRPATGRSSSGCLAFVAKPIQSRDVLDGLLDHLRRVPGPPGPAPAGGRAGRRPGASRCRRGWPTRTCR